MTIARAQLVDVSLARSHHRLTRCVRRAFLQGTETTTARGRDASAGL